MSSLRRLLRAAPISWGRLGRAALLALQLGLGLVPLLERWEPGQPVAHADEQGTRHLFGHDESNCALCAVRTIVADAPAEPNYLPAAQTRQGAAPEVSVLPASRAPAATHPPRAPPILG